MLTNCDTIGPYLNGVLFCRFICVVSRRNISQAGRKYGMRVNTISAGPLKSRAASAIGDKGKKSFIEYAIDYSYANAPLQVKRYAYLLFMPVLYLSLLRRPTNRCSEAVDQLPL